jgi:bifunctional non-homologous end joining protein LigD
MAEPAPMLATLADKVPHGWIYERKLDGVRILATCSPDGPRLTTRSGQPASFDPDGLPRRDCILDGEAVAFVSGKESFSQIQQGRATHLVFFDVLRLDGKDVRALPWHARRQLLDEVELTEPALRLPFHRGRPGLLEQACRAGWEGLIAKDPQAPYRGGRSRAWLKLKCLQAQEFVIGGYTAPRGARPVLGALLLGYHDARGLRYAGKVGTGFDATTLRHLGKALAPLRIPDSPFVDGPSAGTWVRPMLVCEVAYMEWTPAGLLRHPRFRGLRRDKRAHEVVREVAS